MKISIEQIGGRPTVTMKQGVQKFTVGGDLSKDEAEWLANRLREAIGAFAEEEYQRGIADGKIIKEHGSTNWQTHL